MATAVDTSKAPDTGSFLGALAEHEGELLVKLDTAKTEAREIVENAKGEARRILQQGEAKLVEEVGGLRRASQEAREGAFRGTVSAAEQKLEGAQANAMQRVPEVARTVVDLFMPKSGGGNA